MRNLWTYSLMWNMGFAMHGHANFALKWTKCRFCTQQCNAMKNFVMFTTFFPLSVILTFFSFSFFSNCWTWTQFLLDMNPPYWYACVNIISFSSSFSSIFFVRVGSFGSVWFAFSFSIFIFCFHFLKTVFIFKRLEFWKHVWFDFLFSVFMK